MASRLVEAIRARRRRIDISDEVMAVAVDEEIK
jgi:hypothetical protein